ncbi:MAG: fibronectin type III domain-containing protein [Chloroflexi bacterium]|nr:fibronectin type III domain-containing protein [Chloroflexota bacterium]
MYAKNLISMTRKTLYGMMLIALFFAAFGGVSLPFVRAQVSTTTTYVNNLDGYSILHPTDWYVYPAKDSGSGTDISSTTLNGIENPGLRLNIIAFNNSEKLSIPDWHNNYVSTIDPNTSGNISGMAYYEYTETIYDFLDFGPIDNLKVVYISRNNKIFRLIKFCANNEECLQLDSIIASFSAEDTGANIDNLSLPVTYTIEDMQIPPEVGILGQHLDQDSPVALHAPWQNGVAFILSGSYYGEGAHNDTNNDYYATDWNKVGTSCDQDAGQPVLAAGTGVAILARNYDPGLNSGGKVVRIQSNVDSSVTFAIYHLQDVHVAENQTISSLPTQIGTVGETGMDPATSCAHIHLSVRRTVSGIVYSIRSGNLSGQSVYDGVTITSQNGGGNSCDATSLPSGYNKCADEGGTCSFSGTLSVYYGANSCYKVKSFSNGVVCDNNNFGDPAPGVGKACHINYSQPPTGNWTAQYFNGHDHWWDNNNFNNKMCEQNFNSTGLDRNYGSGAPCNNGVSDNWVAEYNGTFNFTSGSYVFYAQNDDGLKIWVNGSNIMERGGSSGYYPRCPAINLSGDVPIRAILREEGGDARVKIAWSTDTSVCIPPSDFTKSSPFNSETGVSTSPTLIWQSSPYASKYYYCIDTSNNNNCDSGWQDVGTATSKALSGLTAGTTYYWQARANNEGGEKFGNNGTWWSFTTQTLAPSAPTLSSPANGTTFNRTDSVVLSWNASSGATQYYAEFSGGPNININSGWTSNISWTLNSQWGGVYQWRVKARNGSGVESGWSEVRTLNIRPGTPSNLSASVLSSDQISLTWSASSDAPSNIDGYRIYRNGSAIATVGGSTTTYQNDALTCNTSYSYFVRAYKGSLESNSSSTVNATTQACPPAIRAVGADTRDGNWGLKTSFVPGDPIQWTIHVENTTSVDTQVDIGYKVINPSNVVIHDSTHTVTTGPGTLVWGLPSTVGMPGGTYTLIGSVTYQGVKTESIATYTVTGPSPITATFRSTGAYDGYIWESTELSNIGFGVNVADTTFLLGDDNSDRQYRAVLSFNTSSLPDNAVITKVRLRIMMQSVVGTNPFTTHSRLRAAIRKPFFGTSVALVQNDFQAVPGLSVAGTFGVTAVNNWYTAILGSSAYPNLNLLGTTQFRLYFVKDDNDDMSADYVRFFSGNYATANARPTLIIEYYIPTSDSIGETPAPVIEYYVP